MTNLPTYVTAFFVACTILLLPEMAESRNRDPNRFGVSESGTPDLSAAWPEPSLRIQAIVQEMPGAKTKFSAWTEKHGLIWVSVEEGRDQVRYVLTGTPHQVAVARGDARALGEVTDLQFSAVDRRRERQDLGFEYIRLLSRLESHQAARPVVQDNGEWARQMEDLQNQTGRMERRLMHLEAWDTVATAEILLQTESNTPTYSEMHFVNMPGIEYVALFFENPSSDYSAEAYHGAQIKYLFTRGKSYLYFGLLHPITETKSSDSSAATENFTFGFGQDFYSRRLGQGLRQAFNLYTGYQLGGAYLTSDAESRLVWAITPCVGLELFKTRRILLDSRVGYFIPFEHNRELRGLITQASFNFVF